MRLQQPGLCCIICYITFGLWCDLANMTIQFSMFLQVGRHNEKVVHANILVSLS